jgi:hypothetical protein
MEAGKGLTQSTDVPQAVVDRSKTSTVLGVGNLSQEHGRAELGPGVSKTKQKTAAHEGTDVLGRALKSGTNDHQNAPEGDREFTANTIGGNGAAQEQTVSPKLRAGRRLLNAEVVCLHERDRTQAADLVQRTQQAELGALRRSEKVVPCLEVLNAVEEHAVIEERQRSVSRRVTLW